jgi:hypothetical protein
MSLKKIKYEPNLSEIVKSKKNKSYKRKSKPEQSNSKTLKRLRTKFLDKIKSYKKTRGLDSANQSSADLHTTSNNKSNSTNIKVVDSDTDSKFNNEFNKSLEYLEQLSKEKKIKEKKQHNAKLNNINQSISHDKINKKMNKKMNKKARKMLHNKTIKNTSAYKHENVYLELPEEMCDPPSFVNTTTCVTDEKPFHIKTECVSDIELKPSAEIVNDLPYGVLKNGNKPTFRQWKRQQTMKNIGSSKKSAITIQDSCNNLNENASNLQRKEALNQFKQHYQNKTTQDKMADKSLADKSLADNSLADNSLADKSLADNSLADNSLADKPGIRITKRRTIRYDLGKKNRKIGILIKNRETRKNTQNKLAKIKKTNISQIKSALREKNIIKIGSVAPPDVLRKLYEETIKCGDIENTSSTALIHNYMNDS